MKTSFYVRKFRECTNFDSVFEYSQKYKNILFFSQVINNSKIHTLLGKLLSFDNLIY